MSDEPSAVTGVAEDDPNQLVAAAVAAASLPEPAPVVLVPHSQVPLAAAEDESSFWEAPLFARIETITANAEDETPGVTTENILAWSKHQFKGLTVYFAPEYKPSDPTAWARLKSDLQEAAAQQGFSLVSKGAKGKSPADKLRQVLICARGRVVPHSRKATASMRPTDPAECCRFRLTVHQDLNLDRFYVKGGQNNPIHKFHSKLTEDECLPKKKRARTTTCRPVPKEATVAHQEDDAPVAGTVPANIVWHPTSLSRTDRWSNHKGAVLWFTGLSGSGKSSIANEVEVMLAQRNVKTYLLDGDNLRHGLCSDLAFSEEDRNENLRRTAEVAKLMADAGMVVLAAFVSPYESHRDRVKGIIVGGSIPFVEIYVKASLATCEKRDPKGLYVKARQGLIANFTGISDPYEEPSNPDILLDADTETIQVLADHVIQNLDYSGKIENDGEV